MPTSESGLRRLATIASVAVAATLIGAKLVAYYKTGSVALLSSMLDSGMDLLASIVAAFAVHRAMKPPDLDHRYGHGKAEPLAGLAQAAFIAGSSILLGIEAFDRFLEPKDLQNAAMGYGVMGISIVLTLVLLVFQSYVLRKTSSFAIKADRMHYVGDIATNLAVAVTFALEELTSISWLDPLFAIGIAATLLYSAGKILKDALDILMDRELPDEDRARILQAALAVPGVDDVHDVRTRSDSGRIFVELHVEVDPEMKIKDAHDIAERTSEAIIALFPNADILVHQDPSGHEEERLDQKIHTPSTPQTA